MDISPVAVGSKSGERETGSRMQSTGEAGVREAYVIDAGLVVSPKIIARNERRVGQCRTA